MNYIFTVSGNDKWCNFCKKKKKSSFQAAGELLQRKGLIKKMIGDTSRLCFRKHIQRLMI